MLVRKDLLEKLIDMASVSIEYLNAKDDEGRWITLKPHGSNSEDYRRLKLKSGETPKEAIDRAYKKDDKKEIKKGFDISPTYESKKDFVKNAISNAHIDEKTSKIFSNIHKLPKTEVKNKNDVQGYFTPPVGSLSPEIVVSTQNGFYHELGHSLDCLIAKESNKNNPKFEWLSMELTEENQKIINKLNKVIPSDLESKFKDLKDKTTSKFENEYVKTGVIKKEVIEEISKIKDFGKKSRQSQESTITKIHKKISNKYYNLSKEKDYRQWSCLSDIYDALTFGRSKQSMLGNHGEDYWMDFGGLRVGKSHPINAEIFANYVEMKLGNYKEQLNYLKKNEPNLYKKLDDVYSKAGEVLEKL